MDATQSILTGKHRRNDFDLLPDPLPVILSAKPEGETRVRLTFSDGTEGVVDFDRAIRKGGVLRPMAQPEFFRQVQVGDDGRYLTWPGGLDFCADALWLEVTGKARPISGDD